jgi:hypothetical protein
MFDSFPAFCGFIVWFSFTYKKYTRFFGAKPIWTASDGTFAECFQSIAVVSPRSAGSAA